MGDLMHHCGYISEGVCYRWKVETLIEAAQNIECCDFDVFQVNLKHCFWFEEIPNVEQVLQHFKQVQNTDLSHPIILAPDGTILDGIHRIVKARLDGKKTLKAVRFETLPEAESQEWVGDPV